MLRFTHLSQHHKLEENPQIFEPQIEGHYAVAACYPPEGIASGIIGIYFVTDTYEKAVQSGIQHLINECVDPDWLSVIGPEGRMVSYVWTNPS